MLTEVVVPGEGGGNGEEEGGNLLPSWWAWRGGRGGGGRVGEGDFAWASEIIQDALG